MSAKWRRSKRLLKWIDPEKPVNLAQQSKILKVQKFKPLFGVRSKKFRPPRMFGKETLKEPKPLIDIFQEESWLTIVAEIAGFNKETLKIDVKNQKLTLSAKAKGRKYYKSLNLPKVVIPNAIHTTYKNGVLEIKLKKAFPEQTIKKQVG
jgi:HSP20 family molecular chaperone IbpA